MPSLSPVILAAAIAGAAASEPVAPPATPQDVRAAVERSLPVIEKVGTAWMKERKCNSCHVVTFLVWSHNEAAAHGLKVDRQKLDEWTKWSLADSLASKYYFRLRPHAMEALKAGGMLEPLLAKLKPLGEKTYLTQKEFLDALEKALGPEDFARHKDLVIQLATLPNNGGGEDTLAQILLGRATQPAEKATAESYNSIRSLLLEWQEPKGWWQAAGQLPNVKWEGAREMNDATTMWSLLAVSSGKSTDGAVAQGRGRALEFLKDSRPGITLQSLALHLIVAHKFGEPTKAETLRQELVSRQNADGGWSWVKTNETSNAFATGQALYAMGQIGRDGKDPAVQRAWQFLLRTQGQDGGWEVPQEAVNIRPRKLNVYPHWGTAWAAIGMLETLPKGSDSR